jgi:hypothetical protein
MRATIKIHIPSSNIPLQKEPLFNREIDLARITFALPHSQPVCTSRNLNQLKSEERVCDSINPKRLFHNDLHLPPINQSVCIEEMHAPLSTRNSKLEETANFRSLIENRNAISSIGNGESTARIRSHPKILNPYRRVNVKNKENIMLNNRMGYI